MLIPNSNRKKALVIIDVQPAFLNKRNRYIIKNIEKLIKSVDYDLYIQALFHAEKNSIWDKETSWTLPKDKNFHTLKSINKLLENKKVSKVIKDTKSVFQKHKSLVNLLKSNKIMELHITGLQTNDCILATAFESFDKGFFTYVIEECCESDTLKMHRDGLAVLRKQEITNNSSLKKREFLRV